jgi:macrodomain Ter protein organizer (MatP/YcbG family)
VWQVLVETFEDGAHVTRYVDQGPGAPHNSALAQLGSGAMLQVCDPADVHF